MLETAKLGQARAPVAMFGFADKSDGGTRSPRSGAALERQDIDFVAALVLAASDDRLTYWADCQSRLGTGILGNPVGGKRLEMRPIDLRFDGVCHFGPDPVYLY